MQRHHLLPEWHPQQAVVLAWPDEHTDWATILTEVRQTYVALIAALNANNTPVILLCRAEQQTLIKQVLPGAARVLLVNADYDDTWVRDYAFLTCWSAQGMQPLEYRFNGWGNKFDATRDNQINQRVLAPLCQLPLLSYPLVVEGGALEIDQQRHLLSTQSCLLNPQRNGNVTLADYDHAFAQQLGARKVSVFRHGHLQGDDTDGHIDTLVRFTPNNGVVIQSCYNCPDDPHFPGLSALVEECQQALPERQVFELPLPRVSNQQGERLPASYANFLINNEQIVMPVYQVAEDDEAIEVIGAAFPEYRVTAINALPLVQQFGSIHCISMQIPQGTLKPAVLNLLQQGVQCWPGEQNEG